MIARKTVARYALVSFALDLGVLGLIAAIAPLDWLLERASPEVAIPIAASALLGIFLAGGYRLTSFGRRGYARMAPLGFTVGTACGWLLLKLLSQKTDLWQLIPPALEELVPTILVAALIIYAHRALHLARLAGREARVPVAVVSTDARSVPLERWRQRGWRAPHVVTGPTELASHRLTDFRAVVLLVSLRDLQRPALEAIAEARARGLPVMSAARFEEELFGYTPLDSPDDPWLLLDTWYERSSGLYLGAKRLLDIVLALLVGALTLVPLSLLVIGLMILQRGPVFYRQTRAGLNRRPFTLWKLRTMVEGAETETGATFARPRDPRVTRFGRWLRRSHLDELPQLYNILKGDMSFVGPRPERPELDDQLEPLIPYYALRHLVRPGLTGWAQVRLDYSDTPEDAFRKLEHDVYYLKHASFAFDLEILARTVPVVLGLKGT